MDLPIHPGKPGAALGPVGVSRLRPPGMRPRRARPLPLPPRPLVTLPRAGPGPTNGTRTAADWPLAASWARRIHGALSGHRPKAGGRPKAPKVTGLQSTPQAQSCCRGLKGAATPSDDGPGIRELLAPLSPIVTHLKVRGLHHPWSGLTGEEAAPRCRPSVIAVDDARNVSRPSGGGSWFRCSAGNRAGGVDGDIFPVGFGWRSDGERQRLRSVARFRTKPAV
jgi:hypothetical protein